MKRITIIILFSLALFECHNADRDEIKRGQEQFFYFAALALYRPNYCEPPQLILEEGQTYNITLEAGKRFWFKFSANTDTVGLINKKIRLTVNYTLGTTFKLNGISCSSPINESSSGIVPKLSTANQSIYELTINSSNVFNTLILNAGDPNVTISYVLF
ncbi:MAG: hypothetical protein MH321_17835 [Leptospiraceae bacterium]|nr:hypothetical protein [Leptospiraceae bacterium]